MTQQPQAKYRHDYRAPHYQITDIDLTFDLVTRKDWSLPRSARPSVTVHQMFPSSQRRRPQLVSVQMNDEPWTARRRGRMVISNLPERLLKIINEISPAANTALEGLYQSG
ncbi:hypothetical protein ACNKHU_05650 [Shigella flexneri]